MSAEDTVTLEHWAIHADVAPDWLRNAAADLRTSDGYVSARVALLLSLADQIEAQTKPPKPTEPTGLGAVVEEIDGAHWVRVTSRTGPWWRNHQGRMVKWDQLSAVRVVSEGVTA